MSFLFLLTEIPSSSRGYPYVRDGQGFLLYYFFFSEDKDGPFPETAVAPGRPHVYLMTFVNLRLPTAVLVFLSRK